MDKYEFNIKVEQIKKLMKKKDFATAIKIADTIEWKKVKENPLLIMAADVYEIAGKYDEAREALLLAYERTGLGRQLAYRLCRLSVKRGDFVEAKEFYDEFTRNSPRDAGKYILQYEMAKGKGEPLEVQIQTLETFIEEDMDDRWAYELARLYHKAHLGEKCVELCDTIILWFADGKYVEKALELKQLYVPLSESQKLKYEAQKSRKLEEEPIVKNEEKEASNETYSEEYVEVEESKEAPKEENEILDQVHEMDIDVNSIHVKDYSANNKYDTMNLQKELARSVSSMVDNTIEIFKPVPTGAQEVEAEDQIEGQMSLEEVLAMFESGEFNTKDETDETDENMETEQETAIEVDTEVDTEEAIEADIEVDTEEAEIESELEIVMEDSEEDSEMDLEADSEVQSETQIDEDLEIEIEELELESEDTSEEYSEEAESDIQETREIMFNLKEDFAEAEAEDEAKEMEVKVDEINVDDIKIEIYEAESEMEETEETELEDVQNEEFESEEFEEAAEEEIEPEELEEPKKDKKKDKKKEKDIKPVEEKQSDVAKRELKNFISKFTGVQGLDKQILKVMQSVLKTDVEPVKFIFVKGEVKSGKTTLAIDVIKLANKIIKRREQKIAKIKGINLNDKSMDTLLEVLDGSDVLIERVSDVTAEVFVEFIDKLKEEGKPRVVVFEDEKSLADTFLSKVPEPYCEFANIIDIKVNKIRDWAKVAEAYAKEKGYVIDEMGTLALSAKIDQLRAITLVVHKNHVEQLIDGAIAKSNKLSIRNIIAKFKNKTKDGYRILTEKNFAD